MQINKYLNNHNNNNNIRIITATTAITCVAHQCTCTAWGSAQGVNGTAVGAWHLRG